MRLLALIKKEILLLTKNWFSYFFALLVPVLALIVNVIMASSLVATINVGFIENELDVNELMHNDLINFTKISFLPIYYENIKQAFEGLETKAISLLVSLENEREIVLYHDSNRQDSLIAMQYLVNGLQTSISKDLLVNYPEEVYNLQAKQKYVIKDFQDIGEKACKGQGENNIMVLFAFMWILIYFPLNLSISQILSEKSSGTMYYFFKLKTPKILIILAKQVAVVVQCVLSTLALMLIIKLTGVYSNTFQLIHLILFIFLIIAMSSLGYFFGLILKNDINTTLITLFLTLPTMVITSLNTSSTLDKFVKVIPSYYISQVIRDILFEGKIRINYLATIFIFMIVFYALSVLIFTRREPAKLCKFL